MIAAGGNVPPNILVFRGGKYWKFDNRPTKDKPFGDLLDGALKAKPKWKGIHFPGAVGNYLEDMLIVFKNKYSQYSPEDEPKAKDKPIIPKVIETPDEPELNPEDRGALIPLDDKKNRYGKIQKDKVCAVKVVQNRMFWSGKCRKVGEDVNNFPPDIIAAIKPKDNNWYFFDENGKYCKRMDGNTEKV